MTFLALSIIDFLVVLLSLGLNGSLVRYSKEHFENDTLHEFLKEVYGFIIIIQVVFFALIVLFPSFWSNLFFGSLNLELTYFIAFYLPFKIIRQIIFSIYWGLNEFLSRGFTEIIAPSINLLILFIIFCLNTPQELKLYFILGSYLISEFLSVIILNVIFKSKNNFSFFRFSIPSLKYSYQFKKNLKFGIWSLSAALILTAMSLIDRASINSFVSQSILGKYLVIYSLSSYFIVLVTVISNVLLTNYINDWKINKSVVIKKLKRSFYTIIIALSLLAFCFYYFLSHLVHLLYGDIYSGFEYVFPYLFISIIFQINYMIFGNLSALSEKPKITTFALIPGLIVNLIGNLFFVPYYGINAVVITSIFAFLCISFALHFLLNKNNINVGYSSVAISIMFGFLIYYIF